MSYTNLRKPPGFLEVSINLRFMQGNDLTRYFKESIQELGKVTWPTKNQAIKLTAIVLVFLLVSAVILSLFDYAFNLGFNELIRLSK